MRLAVGRSISRPGGLIVDNRNRRYTEELWSGAASIGLPLLRDQTTSGDLSFSYNVDWLRNVSGAPDPTPDAAAMRVPEEGVVAGVSARWSMSASHRAAFVNGAIDGYSLQTALRMNHPDLGSDFKSLELSYRWSIFHQMPWAWDHTATFRVNGAIETTDRLRDGPYVLGGLGTQNIAQSILDNVRVGTGVLRGYEPGKLRGRQFHLANLEYRLPLLTIERGFHTLPIYLRRLHAAFFADAGYARDGDFDWREIRPSLGAALRLDAVFGFYDGGTFELGYARGLRDDGVGEWWFLLTGGI
jgi:hypothetical protein